MSDLAKVIEKAGGIRLDIGCGENKQPGWVGMDMRDLPVVDIVHDVEVYPWPLDDESVVVAMASHLIEHINPHRGGFVRFMNEVWRVLLPDGEFMIATPHGSSQGYLQDPTHCNPCNEATFAYFDPEEPNTQGLLWQMYKPKPWRIKYLSWSPTANIEVVLAKRREDGYFG